MLGHLVRDLLVASRYSEAPGRPNQDQAPPMTVHEKTARPVALIFFGTWLLLALAIADFPPPPGFVILALILLACALLVYLRVPVYLRWQLTPSAHGYADEDTAEQRIVAASSTMKSRKPMSGSGGQP